MEAEAQKRLEERAGWLLAQLSAGDLAAIDRMYRGRRTKWDLRTENDLMEISRPDFDLLTRLGIVRPSERGEFVVWGLTPAGREVVELLRARREPIFPKGRRPRAAAPRERRRAGGGTGRALAVILAVAVVVILALAMSACTLRPLDRDQLRAADEPTLWRHLDDRLQGAMLADDAADGGHALYTAGLRRELMERFHPGTPDRHRPLVEMGQLENGMDEVSVALAWGRPYGKRADTSPWGRAERWWWGSEFDPWREATFRDGQLIWWTIHQH
jgi:hypothetical protein